MNCKVNAKAQPHQRVLYAHSQNHVLATGWTDPKTERYRVGSASDADAFGRACPIINVN